MFRVKSTDLWEDSFIQMFNENLLPVTYWEIKDKSEFKDFNPFG